MKRRIRVLIADDHRLISEGVQAALDRTEGFAVVGVAEDGTQVLPLVNRLRPDVLLLDISMPRLNGLRCLELVRERHPAVKVVMLSGHDDREHIEAALKRGACSYILKSINPIDLPAALREAVEETVYHMPTMPARNPRRRARELGLSEREVNVLAGVARGLSNRAIAGELWVTEQTVKFHLTNVYRKLKVANRTEAARAAFRLGVVDGPLLVAAAAVATGLLL